MNLPRAILLDLDDTILDDSTNVDMCWREACAAGADELGHLDLQVVQEAIRKTSRWYWSDPDRHREGPPCAGIGASARSFALRCWILASRIRSSLRESVTPIATVAM
jgi:FMN phosphatase YigB (HAD superfamily)